MTFLGILAALSIVAVFAVVLFLLVCAGGSGCGSEEWDERWDGLFTRWLG